MASRRCVVFIESELSRSAIVRDTFNILSHARADSPSSSIAASRIELCSGARTQYLRICAGVIAAFVLFAMENFANHAFWISRAASTRFLISAEDSDFWLLLRSLIGNAEASTCMSMRSKSGPEILALYCCI